MRDMLMGLAATVFLAACIVVREVPVPAPPVEDPLPAESTSAITYQKFPQPSTAGGGATPYVYSPSWPDVRYVLWTEYYECTPEEVYYLDNTTGYDDCDMLYMLCVSRWARVPIRQVVYEYDRCGRSLFTLCLSYGLSGYELYCPEIPPSTYCPPPYRSAYDCYWRGRLRYLTNAECRALVDLKIGIEYYGYRPSRYFDAYTLARRRGAAHPFRTMAVHDRRKAGTGNRTVLFRPVTRRLRPWEAESRSTWETYRAKRRATASITAARERERNQQARRIVDSDQRRKHRANAVHRAVELNTFREQEDRGYRAGAPARTFAPPSSPAVRGTKPPSTPSRPTTPSRTIVLPSSRRQAVTPPSTRPATPPKQAGVTRRRIVVPDRSSNRSAERSPAPPPSRGVERRPPPPPPSRNVERRTPPPPPPRRVERRTPPPPPPRRVERRTPPPPPPRRIERKPPPPPRRSGSGTQRRTPPPPRGSSSGGGRGSSRRK